MNDNLNISIQNKIETERFILISVIGLVKSAIVKAVTVDDISTYMFNPFTIEKLKKMNVNANILEILEEGCILEDIEDLRPDILERELNKLQDKAIFELKKIKKYPRSNDKWLGEYE